MLASCDDALDGQSRPAPTGELFAARSEELEGVHPAGAGTRCSQRGKEAEREDRRPRIRQTPLAESEGKTDGDRR
jgi:hypothetical protein